MSFLKYLFYNDWSQRRDIEELRETQHRMAISSAPTSPGGAPERGAVEIDDEVTELSATVRVLMGRLQAANLLDIASIQQEVDESLRPKGKPRAQPKVEGPAVEVACMKCH